LKSHSYVTPSLFLVGVFVFEKNPCYCRERNPVPDTGATAYGCLFENRRNGTVAFRDVFGRTQAVSSGSPDSISAVLVKGVSIYHRKMKEKSEPSETAQPENGQKSRAVPSALYNLQQEGGS